MEANRAVLKRRVAVDFVRFIWNLADFMVFVGITDGAWHSLSCPSRCQSFSIFFGKNPDVFGPPNRVGFPRCAGTRLLYAASRSLAVTEGPTALAHAGS